MVYVPFVDSKPEITDSGATVVQNTRENLEALRDAVMMGKMPDWDMTATQGTGSVENPQYIAWRDTQGTGDLEVRATITWASGNPSVILYEFTGNRTAGTPTYDTIATVTYTYSSGHMTLAEWS